MLFHKLKTVESISIPIFNKTRERSMIDLNKKHRLSLVVAVLQGIFILFYRVGMEVAHRRLYLPYI